MKKLPAISTLCLVALVGSPALAQQERSDRLDRLTNLLADTAASPSTTYVSTGNSSTIDTRATPAQMMRMTISQVSLDNVPGRMALDIWSQQTGIPLVINWASLQAQGVDPDSPVTLNLRNIPASQALQLIVRQVHPDPIADDALMVDVEQWYVTVTTRHDALRRSTTRMYFVGDLLMDIPNFDGAPGFSLTDALSNTNSGGGGGASGGGSGGGNQTLFRDRNEQQAERVPTQQDRVENLLNMVRTTIEPDIWLANGGQYASVRYYRGMLIVNAPDFVHEQLGFTSVSTQPTTRSSASGTRSNTNSASTTRPSRPRSTSGNVAGVAPRSPNMAR